MSKDGNIRHRKENTKCSPTPLPVRYPAFLSVRFGNTFEFVLLLDGVAVGAALGGVNELVGQALGN